MRKSRSVTTDDNEIELCVVDNTLDVEISTCKSTCNYSVASIILPIDDVIKLRDYLNECIDELRE